MLSYIDFTIVSFVLSIFISSFSLRALKTRSLSEKILSLRGDPGPSTRDSFTYGESVQEAGSAPTSLFGIFSGDLQGSRWDDVEAGDCGQPEMNGRDGEGGGQWTAAVEPENLEFWESSPLTATGTRGWGKDLATWLGDEVLDDSNGRKAVFPADGGEGEGSAVERSLGLDRFGATENLLLLWSVGVAVILALDGAPSFLSLKKINPQCQMLFYLKFTCNLFTYNFFLDSHINH